MGREEKGWEGAHNFREISGIDLGWVVFWMLRFKPCVHNGGHSYAAKSFLFLKKILTHISLGWDPSKTALEG